MYIILKLKQKSIFKVFTKEFVRAIKIVILAFILVITIFKINYKTVYEVKVKGETLGYVESQESFETLIQDEILNVEGKNIDSVSLEKEPQYEKILLARNKETNETEIIEKLKQTTITTYKFYAVTLNSKNQAFVDTIEEAEEVVNKIKSEHKGDDLKLNLSIDEKYTQDAKKVKTETTEDVELTVEKEIKKLLDEEEAKKALATINGINLSVLPVTGRISSRFGVSSSIRSGTHTGLDIACASGTDIKAVAKGKVVFAERNGAYGNLVKIDHGNGVETWYAHCSKIYAKVGDKVSSGDVIAAVGSTGNSTGPHLHLEIRIEGTAVNPQKYLYKQK